MLLALLIKSSNLYPTKAIFCTLFPFFFFFLFFFFFSRSLCAVDDFFLPYFGEFLGLRLLFFFFFEFSLFDCLYVLERLELWLLYFPVAYRFLLDQSRADSIIATRFSMRKRKEQTKKSIYLFLPNWRV